MSDEDLSEKIGYGHPPKKNRFRKGASGNPKGRPKASKNVANAVELELDGKVTVIENGRKLKLSRGEVIAKTLVTKAMKGDLRAFDAVTKLLPKRFREPLAEANKSEPLDPYEAEVLERYISRRIAKEDSHD
jgi:hypothetical protein